MATTSVFLPGKSHGQRSLAGYIPWGCQESDTTERLTLSLSFTYGFLVPWPGMEPVPPAVESQSPKHWTAREFPRLPYLNYNLILNLPHLLSPYWKVFLSMALLLSDLLYIFIYFAHDVSAFTGGSDGKESACNARDLGSIPRLGRSPEENGYPLQYSGLENPMDRGAWWATVHGVAESDTTVWLTLSHLLFVHRVCSSLLPLPHPCLQLEQNSKILS